MSGVNGGNQDVDIDLGRVFSAVWRHKTKILAATALAAGISFIATSMIKPSYRGEARMLIESRSPNLSGGEGSTANDPVLDSLNITSQAQLLQSSDLIKRVARELKLHEVEEFDPAGQSLLPNPLVLLGLAQNPLDLAPEERVIKEFREKLEVYAVENSRVIAIEFSSHDQKLAAAIPNKMAEVYLSLQSGAKVDTHTETARWLEPEIASLTQKVGEAERKVADYRSNAGLFQTNDTSSFSAQQLNDISAELARVRGELANARARAENVRNALEAGRQSDTLADVVGSQVIQRLKEAEANLQAQISDQSTVLLEGHPRLKGLRAQLSGIRRQIDSETSKILSSLDSEADVAGLRENQLIQQLNTLKADSARAGEEEVGLRALEREAAAQRQLLETYLARYREATSRLEGNSSPADARIVSSAVEPSEAYFPKVVPIVIVVTLATLILSCLLVMVLELFSGRALRPSGRGKHEEEVETKATPTPVSAVLEAETVETETLPVHVMQQQAARFDRPLAARDEASLQPQDVVLIDEPIETVIEEIEVDEEPAAAADITSELPMAEPVDQTFSINSVAHYLLRNRISVAIGISPSGDDGSEATVMLAREIATRGRTVVVIDMTGSARPTELMALSQQAPGITDLLAGETAFGDAIHPDRSSDAHIIPQGVSDPARAMRNVDELPKIIDALAEAYDLVLVECGPADVSGIARLAGSKPAEIVLSVPKFEDAELARLVAEFDKAGYGNLLVMTSAGHQTPHSGRRAA